MKKKKTLIQNFMYELLRVFQRVSLVDYILPRDETCILRDFMIARNNPAYRVRNVFINAPTGSSKKRAVRV